MSKKYPVVCFTLHETDQSLLNNSKCIEFDTVEEMLEWALKEKRFMCEVTIGEKWGFPLVVAKGDFGEKLISDIECQQACENIGLRYGQ